MVERKTSMVELGEKLCDAILIILAANENSGLIKYTSVTEYVRDAAQKAILAEPKKASSENASAEKGSKEA